MVSVTITTTNGGAGGKTVTYTERRFTTVTTGADGSTTLTTVTSTLGGGGGGVAGSPNGGSSSGSATSSSAQTTAGVSSTPSSNPANAPSPSRSAASGSSTVTSASQTSTQNGTPAAASGSNQPTTQSSSNNGGGFTGGDLAGAAVGCLVGGALIAFLVAFFIFRRNRKSQEDTGGYYHDERRNQKEPLAAAATGEKSSAPSSSSSAGWMAYLPQSADDRTVQSAVKTFFNQIELHVDNFYHRANVSLDPRTREALAQMDSGKLPGRIEEHMQDPRMIIPVIKHSIADLLITRLSPLTFPETSLLPANLAAFPTKLQTPSASLAEGQAAQQAYSQWRLVNAYLYPHPEKDGAYIDDREAKANDVSDILAAAFSPWQTVAGDKGQLQQHERSLVATAGNLGILLMSQPSAFEFKWNAGGSRSGTGRPFLTFPGFWKTSDDQGRTLDPPQSLVTASVLRL